LAGLFSGFPSHVFRAAHCLRSFLWRAIHRWCGVIKRHGLRRRLLGITEAEAVYLRDNRIMAAITTAEAQPWWPNVKDCDARARAFIEILFSLGLGGFNEFTKAISAAVQPDWQTCSAELLDSLWHRQTGKRAETLAAMVLTGEDQVLS
jgi:hypothetical protein